MARVKVVTDSTADIPVAIVRELDITVVPQKVTIGNDTFLDGVNLKTDEFFSRLSQTGLMPMTSDPGPAVMEETYRQLAQTTDSILSIHISSKLSRTYHSALAAKEKLTDRCRILVVDSTLTTMALGFIVIAAAQTALQGASLNEVARRARGMIPQTHLLFFVDTMEYLQRGGRVGKATTLLGTMLNVKPLLRLEDGEIFPLEKVRTRAKALERLYEFVADFPRIEQLAILYSTTPNEAQSLAKRIDPLFPKEKILITTYGATLAAHTGPGALGVVVYEGEE